MSKDFATSPVYWDNERAPDGLSAQIDATIENNFIKLDEVEDKTFDLVRFLFASICYHYETLDTTFIASTNFVLHLFSLLHFSQSSRDMQ